MRSRTARALRAAASVGAAAWLLSTAPDPHALAQAATGPVGAPQRATPVEQTERISAAFVGDLLIHDTLLAQAAEETPGRGFASLWEAASSTLAAADVAYANLEVPVAEGVRRDGSVTDTPFATTTSGSGRWQSVYTGYPLFNAPPDLLDALVTAGVDVVSTANNHALDRGRIGVARTIEALARRRLAYTGTRPPGRTDLSTVTEVGPPNRRRRIAWIACTYSLNGLTNGAELVTTCFDPSGAPSPTVLQAVRALHANRTVDAVIVTPHWGSEYRHAASAGQERLAADLVAAGATAVIGSHPHVIQPIRFVEAGGRRALVAYSLGNFVSDQPEPAMRLGLLLIVDLVPDSNGRLRASSPRYVPLFMGHAPDVPYRRALVVLDDATAGRAAAQAREVLAAVLDPTMRGAPARGRPRAPAVAVGRAPAPTADLAKGAVAPATPR